MKRFDQIAEMMTDDRAFERFLVEDCKMTSEQVKQLLQWEREEQVSILDELNPDDLIIEVE